MARLSKGKAYKFQQDSAECQGTPFFLLPLGNCPFCHRRRSNRGLPQRPMEPCKQQSGNGDESEESTPTSPSELTISTTRLRRRHLWERLHPCASFDQQRRQRRRVPLTSNVGLTGLGDQVLLYHERWMPSHGSSFKFFCDNRLGFMIQPLLGNTEWSPEIESRLGQ